MALREGATDQGYDAEDNLQREVGDNGRVWT